MLSISQEASISCGETERIKEKDLTISPDFVSRLLISYSKKLNKSLYFLPRKKSSDNGSSILQKETKKAKKRVHFDSLLQIEKIEEYKEKKEILNEGGLNYSSTCACTIF